MSGFFRRNRTVLIFALIAVVAVGGFLLVRNRRGSQVAQFQTAPVERGNLVATIGATGTVRAKQTAVLMWQTNGTVDIVNVKVGDNVPQNFVMALLAKTSLQQNIILAEADLASAQDTLDELLNSDTALAQASQNLVAAKQGLEDAQKDVVRLDFRRASDDLIDKTQDEIDLANRQVSRAEDAFKRVRKRPDGDPLKAQIELNLINARLDRDQKIARLEWYLGKPSALDAEKYRAALDLAQAKLDDAQREFDRLAAGNLSKIQAAQARLEAAQATLNLARIVAPFPGIATEADPLPGDQVAPGTTAFRLDDLSHLYVDVEVSEVDINSVKVGQPVTLTFDAILGRQYQGEVVEVASVGNTVNGVVNFTVTAELTSADDRVKPGMTAAVNIVVNELQSVLLVPNRAVRLVDGNRVVYLLVDGQSVQKDITLGSSSDTMSVVLGGDVKEGDVIILNPPVQFQGGPGGGGPGGGAGG
jgi:HlyD family secretion protein